jgi:hypothetical protein
MAISQTYFYLSINSLNCHTGIIDPDFDGPMAAVDGLRAVYR